MAEEESGFTFVDKRRSQASEEVAEPAAAAETIPTPEDTVETEDDDFSAGAAPDIYGVLGYCISLLATEAWHKLGLLADPKTGESVTDLAQAKVAIDAVGDLAARLVTAPEEAVPATLRRELQTLVNDLRLNYVSRRGDSGVSRN